METWERLEWEEPVQLETAYVRFTKERDPNRKDYAGCDLIRSIFGKEAIAEDRAQLDVAAD